MKQFRILFFILSLSPLGFTSKAQVLASDSLALVALYNSTNGPGWTNNTNWLTGPVSTWFGIIVSGNRVTEIRMCIVCFGTVIGNNLLGTIPPALGTLSNLTELTLFNNQLTGTIPPELGNLNNLRQLYLFNNQLTGTIPTELGNLSNLLLLRLYKNQLTGTIPPALGTLSNLTELLLDINQLTGTIPPELGNLSNLQRLYLNNNQLSGTIPPELRNLSNLQYLNLYNNQLTGTIPPELRNLSNLQYLNLYNNQLTGTIPPELGNLSNLQRLWLHFNQLTGTIPPELGNLSNLTELWLSNNQLTGSIPPEIGNLINLTQLSLGNNQLTAMPDLSGLTSLTTLSTQNNLLDFGDLEPNMGITGFTYAPQGLIPRGGNQALTTGAPFTATLQVGGSANQYQWRKNGVAISGATSSSFSIPSLVLSDAGTYELFITSSLVPGLTLRTEPIVLSVTAAPLAIVGVSVNAINQPNGSTVTYSSTNVGANTTTNFVINNTGNATMNITSIQITGDYTIVGAPPTSVAIGGNVTVPVRFTPTAGGTRTGTFTITSNADIPVCTINLTGVGVVPLPISNVTVNAVAQPNNSITTYSSTTIGGSTTTNFVISNTGNATMNISNILTTGDYTIVGAAPTSITIGGNVTVPVRFTPTVAGTRTGTIVITSNADIPVYTINLSGVGEVPTPIIEVKESGTPKPNGDAVVFSTTGIGNDQLKQLEITNTGNTSLVITDIQVTGDFSLESAIPPPIDPGNNTLLSLRFAPTGLGARTGTLTILSNGDVAVFTINLTGEGEVEPEVYNVVTTNQNGKHDFLNIKNITFFPQNKVSIFDRWGNKVFERDGYDNAQVVFAGISDDNKSLPDGTYYYVIDKNNGDKPLNGFLYLRR